MIQYSFVKILGLIVTIVLLILSCTINRTDESKSISSIPGYIGKYTSDFPSLNDYAYFVTTEGDSPLLFVNADSCELREQVMHGHIKIHFRSSVKNHTLDIQFSGSEPLSRAYIDGLYPLKIKLEQELFANVCSQETGVQTKENTDVYQEFVTAIFKRFAPECDMNYDKKEGWSCILHSDKFMVTKDHIQDIRKAVIRGSRQPYSLSRKIAITERLFEASQNLEKNPEQLNALCKIFKFSDQNEIPVGMINPTVLESLCDPANIYRKKLTQTIVRHSIEEITILKSLYKSHSKIGLFQIKVPLDQVPSKDLWVTVTPSDTLSERVQSLREALKDTEAKAAGKGSCWHPFYGDKDNFSFTTATFIGLINTDENMNCKHEISEKTQSLAIDYVFQAISSETEFVVSNGNSKLLRLPKGKYNYSIERHSRLPESMIVANSKNTNGDFSWSQRRPSVIVRKW